MDTVHSPDPVQGRVTPIGVPTRSLGRDRSALPGSLTSLVGREREVAAASSNPAPDFHSGEEEDAFWDIHDLTMFYDVALPVTLGVGNQLSENLTVGLDRQDHEELERCACEH